MMSGTLNTAVQPKHDRLALQDWMEGHSCKSGLHEMSQECGAQLMQQDVARQNAAGSYLMPMSSLQLASDQLVVRV